MALRVAAPTSIVTEQFDAALALDPPPTQLTFNGSGNEMLHPRYSDGRMVAVLTLSLAAAPPLRQGG